MGERAKRMKTENANQQNKGQNEMNKLHKSLGGFCEGYSYDSPAHYGCYSCRETYATIEQGINDVLLELEKRQIEADLYQSGGFCMLATVEIDKARTLWVSADGVGLDTVDSDWVDMSDYESYRNDFSPKDLLEWVANSAEKALKTLKANA